MTRFYVGLHEPAHAKLVDRCMVSVNRLDRRKSDFYPRDWIMDSGAFKLINKHGYFPDSVEVYASKILRWSWCGNLVAAASQDFMCEDFVLRKTGLSVAEHQRLTIDRYAALRRLTPDRIHILPVLQGYKPSEYASHVRQYGDLLYPGMWVGVGSVCKRNAKPDAIEEVLRAITAVRPDLRLHGFGIKQTALESPGVVRRLHSADSMAWSFAARYEGRNQNCPSEAIKYIATVAAATARAMRKPVQMELC